MAAAEADISAHLLPAAPYNALLIQVARSRPITCHLHVITRDINSVVVSRNELFRPSALTDFCGPHETPFIAVKRKLTWRSIAFVEYFKSHIWHDIVFSNNLNWP